MNLYDYLLERAEPGDTAIIDRDGRVTYAELRFLAESAAQKLDALGVRSGDRIGLLAENSPFWVASYLGCLKLGAAAVPMPARLSHEQYQALIERTGCQVFCIDPKRSRTREAALTDSSGIVALRPDSFSKWSEHRATSESRHLPTAEIDDRAHIAALMFTSGSTGLPNAVKVSHRNIRANTEAIIEYLQLSRADRTLVPLPFDYCFGASLLHTHLRAGASMVLNNRFHFLEDVVNDLQGHRCTGLAGVPSTFQQLIRRSSLLERSLPSLRYVQQAGGRLPGIFIDEFRSAFPEVSFFVMYGQTEATARISYLPPGSLPEKQGSVGVPVRGVRISIRDSVGVPVRNGERGEVVIEGESVTLGYLNPADDERQAFRDGRLHTGDVGWLDADGFLYLEGRASDFVKINGHRVACGEIEAALVELSGVAEAAVIGALDREIGETMRAFVVPAWPGALAVEDVVNQCRGKLRTDCIPKEVFLVDELPKNAAGKVMKKDLVAQYTSVLTK